MKAIRLHGRGGPDHLVYEEAPQPSLGPREVLVRVAATAIIANELKWDLTYQTPGGEPRLLPIPGHDLSGSVAALGREIVDPMPGLAVGDAVYALTAFGRDGAEAEYAIALPDELAPRPGTLDDVQAAAVPLAALTAWQALFTRAGLSSGQSVLIHGASGGVGTYAVQLARWAGARVIATTSSGSAEFLRDLGAKEIIDYTTTRFEDVVHDVDVVFDTVGGDTLERSWQVVKAGGVLVSVVSPPPADRSARRGARLEWYVVEPSRDQLIQIGELLDSGRIRPIVDQVFPLAEARHAYEAARQGHRHGKIVLTVG